MVNLHFKPGLALSLYFFYDLFREKNYLRLRGFVWGESMVTATRHGYHESGELSREQMLYRPIRKN